MGHKHNHQQDHDSVGNLKVAFFLNLGFTILEIFGGIWTNSVAILSDAIHDLGDSLSLGLAWYLQGKSKQKSDSHYSFGYQRFSLLGALINGLVLIVGAGFVLSETIPRLLHPEQSDPKGMILFAIIGILVNGAAMLKLKSGKSLNERVVSWHLMEDVLGWVVILIASIVLLFWDIPWLDPALSLLILAYVLYNVIKNLRETLHLFLQGTPHEIDIKEIETQLLKIPGVQSVHRTHVWSMDGERHVLTSHIVVLASANVSEVRSIKASTKKLIHTFPIEHATIEVEFEGEECFMGD